ncbi:MAG: hypothetical protein H0V37_07235 [Chloroflexia bacterium]|jgi:hypothetical protein|nr:hypothetical protein [Chloroflexia bacterium]
MTDQEIRLPLLKRLAEQAMSDHAFRLAARDDLDRALIHYGYHLNDAELPLVRQFRDALAEAGVDLALASELSLDIDDDLSVDDLHNLQAALNDSSR